MGEKGRSRLGTKMKEIVEAGSVGHWTDLPQGPKENWNRLRWKLRDRVDLKMRRLRVSEEEDGRSLLDEVRVVTVASGRDRSCQVSSRTRT